MTNLPGSIDDALDRPEVSAHVREVAAKWLHRDPVQACHDADTLAAIMHKRKTDVLAAGAALLNRKPQP